MFRSATISFLLAFMVWAPRAISQLSQAETPAIWRAKEFVQLISTGDRGKFREYARDNFAPVMLDLPMDMHLTVLSSLYDQTRGIEFVDVQETGQNYVVVLTRNKLTDGWIALAVSVEPAPPHRITGIHLVPPVPPIGPKRQLSDKKVARELELFMKKLAEADVFSGAVLLAKDGGPIFERAYGAANKDFDVPNRVDTKFNLGSMNKMFTAVAILQLVEHGKLSLDDPLAKFLPDFPDSTSAKKIRIKHLLTHTAGLGHYFTERFEDSSRAKYRTVDDMMTLAAADEKLLFEPGTRWEYSNTGFLVLGKVIEKVSGQTYYEYIRENIYQPAGMTNTDCYELDKVNPNLAVGYDKAFTDQGVVFSNNLFASVLRGGPQGGGYSTVNDLLKFATALRENKLLSADNMRLMLSPKPELQSPGYGFGFMIDTSASIVGHSGAFTGISSNLDIFIGTNWTAVVMSNYTSDTEPVVAKMRELVAAH